MQVFSSLKDVLNFAIGQEQAAQRFYRDLSGKASDPMVRQLYESLADQEAGHEKHLREMKKAGGELSKENLDSVCRSGYLDARNVPSGVTMKEAVAFAMEKEKSSHMLYVLLADLIDNKPAARLLLKLAEEESRHAEYFKKEYETY
jgi:rubrerythrin